MAKVIDKNAPAYAYFEAVAKTLEAVSVNGYRYEVEDCWQDAGAGIAWTTIICYNDDETGILHSWQTLSPREWNLVLGIRTIDDVASVAKEISNGRYFQDK